MLAGLTALLGSGAGGGGAAYESIATVTASGSSATLTFSGIPSTYKHLQIRGIARQSAAGTNTRESLIRFNSDSGSNYSRQQLVGTGSAVSAAASVSQTASFGIAGVSTSATANAMAASIVDILDYTNTSKRKVIRSLAGGDLSGSGQIYQWSGVWLNTSAITSIDIVADSGNWNSTTTFALYGIKG